MMTKEDIIRMAKECGDWSGQTIEMNDVGLEMFANRVAAAERENIASWVALQRNDVPATGFEMASAIRARGEK